MMDGVVDGMVGSGRALADALADATAARSARAMEALASGIQALARTPDVGRLDALAARARAMLATEALVAAAPSSTDGAAAPLERLVTFQQVAWSAAGDVMTSLADVALPGTAVAALMAVAAELVALVEAEAPPDRPVRLFIASEQDGGELVVAFAAHGIDHTPALGAAGLRALRRAEGLARLVGGGLTRGYGDGLMLVGFSVRLPPCVPDPG